MTVAAVYPGATAETIADTVAAPLEKEINGVEGMLYMSSVNSGNGTLMITVTFNIGTNPDMNAVNVNNRIQAAVPRLPEEVRRQGVVVRKASTTFLQIVSIHSPDNSVDMLTHEQLRHAQRARRAASYSRHRRRADVRSGLFHPHLDAAGQARAAGSHAF